MVKVDLSTILGLGKPVAVVSEQQDDNSRRLSGHDRWGGRAVLGPCVARDLLFGGVESLAGRDMEFVYLTMIYSNDFPGNIEVYSDSEGSAVAVVLKGASIETQHVILSGA